MDALTSDAVTFESRRLRRKIRRWTGVARWGLATRGALYRRAMLSCREAWWMPLHVGDRCGGQMEAFVETFEVAVAEAFGDAAA